MGASNFAYENRCVVVTDEDFEIDNVPARGEYISDNYYHCSYPSYILSDYNDFKFHDIVITSGYYEGACIDFARKYDMPDIDYFLGDWDYYSCKCDFVKEACYQFGITAYRINKLCGNIKDFAGNFEAWIKNAYDKISDYVITQEEAECNKVIDQIKSAYGYEEYYTVGRFSDGTSLYKQVV